MNIMIVGVGGQGTLLASKILGDVALRAGLDVKASEIHGMAQRGGSVVTFVRFSDSVASPKVDNGCADVILAFERLEAARALPALKEGGTVIVNTREISPMPVVTGAAKYPDGLLEAVADKGARVVALDADAMASAAGTAKAANVVLLGALAVMLDFEPEEFYSSIERQVKPRFVELNKEAFKAGYEKGKRCIAI